METPAIEAPINRISKSVINKTFFLTLFFLATIISPNLSISYKKFYVNNYRKYINIKMASSKV